MFAYDRLQYANGGVCHAPTIFNAKPKQCYRLALSTNCISTIRIRVTVALGRGFYPIAIDSVLRPSSFGTRKLCPYPPPGTRSRHALWSTTKCIAIPHN